MGKYRIVELQTTKDGVAAQSITAFDTKDAAMMAYHQALAGCYASTTLAAFAVVCLNSHGGTEAREYWEAPTEG